MKPITCELGDKKYSVDFISGRALREMGPAMEAYQKILKAAEAVKTGVVPEEIADVKVDEVYDELVKWFCLIFGNQFTPDEVYDHYPADRMVADIVLAMLAVQAQTTEVLDSFPTTAAKDAKREKS